MRSAHVSNIQNQTATPNPYKTRTIFPALGQILQLLSMPFLWFRLINYLNYFSENSFKESLNLFLCDASNENQGFFQDIKLTLSPEEICKNTQETNYTIIVS